MCILFLFDSDKLIVICFKHRTLRYNNSIIHTDEHTLVIHAICHLVDILLNDCKHKKSIIISGF